MPKDIRSYFTSSFKTTQKVLSTDLEETKINRKRKKNLKVLSDSDEEPVEKTPKQTKKNVPEKRCKETSKYFEIDKESLHKHLGDAPVKRRSAPPKAVLNNEVDEIINLIDDDNDDVWEKSFVKGSKTSKEAKSSSNKEDVDVIDAKKRKLNSDEQKEELEALMNKKNPVNFKNLISNDDGKEKHIENGKRSIEISMKTSPKKVNSPRKQKTPSPQKQKTPSPQKCITCYLSPKKLISPRFNQLDVTKTIVNLESKIEEVAAKNNDNVITNNCSTKGVTATNGSPKISNSKKLNSKPVEHTLSPDNSDVEIVADICSNNSTPIKVNKAAKVNSKPIAEHTLSSDSSEDEGRIKKNVIVETSPKINYSEKKTITNSSKLDNKTKPVKKKVETINIPLIKPKPTSSIQDLWVEKYKPVTLKNIIGQQGEKSNVNKLLKWLENWFSNHSGNKKIPKPSPWAKDDSGAYFKAALLSGPPGIGKTTTAHLVCQELNMDVVEFNASDTRSKKLLNLEISELLSSKSLSPFLLGGGATSRQHVLVMDEVDGMAGNEDRGGVQELISLIKNTKIPIICMCNDRNHPKIRSLANYCFDLRFNRPRVDQIKGAMMSICFKENLKIKPEVLTEIIASTNQDIRLVLNHLSILSARKEQTMNVTNKEIKLGPWDVVRKVFSHEEQKKMSIHDKSDLFFHDYSIAPLFVQENYLNVIPNSPKAKTKQGKMELFAKTAESLCFGDMVERTIRSHNVWSLLPAQAIFSSVIPGHILSGRVGGLINFPAWFGKNSKKNKMDRLCQEIQLHTRLKACASKEAIITDYAYALRDGIANPMVNLGNEGVASSLQFLHDYSLFREDISSLSELTTWPNTRDPFTSLDSKVKAAFTRAYNKNPVLPPFSISGAAIKKGRKGNTEEDELEMLNNEEGNEELGTNVGSDLEEDDDLSTDGMINIKKRDKQENTKKEKQKREAASSSKPRGGKRGKKV